MQHTPRPRGNARPFLRQSVTMSRVNVEAVIRAKIELLKDVRIALQQIESGQAVTNREAKAELRRRFAR
jgi:hypothetical protein